VKSIAHISTSDSDASTIVNADADANPKALLPLSTWTSELLIAVALLAACIVIQCIRTKRSNGSSSHKQQQQQLGAYKPVGNGESEDDHETELTDLGGGNNDNDNDNDELDAEYGDVDDEYGDDGEFVNAASTTRKPIQRVAQ